MDQKLTSIVFKDFLIGLIPICCAGLAIIQLLYSPVIFFVYLLAGQGNWLAALSETVIYLLFLFGTVFLSLNAAKKIKGKEGDMVDVLLYLSPLFYYTYYFWDAINPFDFVVEEFFRRDVYKPGEY